MLTTKKMEEKIKKTKVKVTVTRVVSVKDNLREMNVGETRKYCVDDFISPEMLQDMRDGKLSAADARKTTAANFGKRAYDLKKEGMEFYYHREGERMIYVTRIK